METANQKITLLIIGNKDWCTSYSQQFKDSTKYKYQTISNFKDALKRLEHNSYDILLLQQNYFKYNSIRLSQRSYAMSRPSIILCNSYLKYFIYNFWKKFSDWTNKYTTSKKLIHIKMISDSKINKYLIKLLKQHDMIKQISDQIRHHA